MQARRDWFWRFRALRTGDYAAILIVIALAVLAAIALVTVPIELRGNVNGFGPEWDCSYAGQGDPVCVKRNSPDSK